MWAFRLNTFLRALKVNALGLKGLVAKFLWYAEQQILYQRSEILELPCLWRRRWFPLKIASTAETLGKGKSAGKQSCVLGGTGRGQLRDEAL